MKVVLLLKELSKKLKNKKDKFLKRKEGHIIKEGYQKIAQMRKDGVWKAKAKNEFRVCNECWK